MAQNYTLKRGSRGWLFLTGSVEVGTWDQDSRGFGVCLGVFRVSFMQGRQSGWVRGEPGLGDIAIADWRLSCKASSSTAASWRAGGT